jgi:MraZ protein
MQDFLGRHDFTMDERGRVPIPARFRDALSQEVILTQVTAPYPCVRVFSREGFARQAEFYTADPLATLRGQVLRHALYGGAYRVNIDRQGRILIPQSMRREAGLEGPVVITGLGDNFEIWNAATYEEMQRLVREEQRRFLEGERGG